MKYKDFIFDLYGTLIDIRTDEDLPELWMDLSSYYSQQGASYQPGELRIAYHRLVTAAEAGVVSPCQDTHEAHPEIKIELVFQQLFQEKGVKVDLAEAVRAGLYFRRLSTKHLRLYDGAKELLRGLRAQGGRIWLLSNAQHIFTTWELESLRLREYFDGIYLSSDYGVKKPDRHFFDVLLRERNIVPEHAVMIGNDGLCDIRGGREAGMSTFYIHSNLSPDEPVPGADYILEQMNFGRVLEILLGDSVSLPGAKEKNDMERLQQFILERTEKECAQCSNEELYRALLW